MHNEGSIARVKFWIGKYGRVLAFFPGKMHWEWSVHSKSVWRGTKTSKSSRVRIGRQTNLNLGHKHFSREWMMHVRRLQ